MTPPVAPEKTTISEVSSAAKKRTVICHHLRSIWTGVTLCFILFKYRIIISKNLRWRVVADQVDGFSPDHSPHVHVVTHIDGAADTIACRPHQLKIETHIQVKESIAGFSKKKCCQIDFGTAGRNNRGFYNRRDIFWKISRVVFLQSEWHSPVLFRLPV